MANVLVVANETLGGIALRDAVLERAKKGDNPNFFVIAPQNNPKSGYVVYERAVLDAARYRVERLLEDLREVGIEAKGEVRDPDPYRAIQDAVEEDGIDEIIISTHPQTRSGWLRRDLVSRIKHDFNLPVHHVVVDLDKDRAAVPHILVVANQTVGAEPLFEYLRKKKEDNPNCHFIVIVPPLSGHGHHLENARKRLDSMLMRMREYGMNETGAMGDPDPFTAIMNALHYYRVNEIVISTFPQERSGWLRSNLIERVQRSTSLPVEHVVSDVEVQNHVDTR